MRVHSLSHLMLAFLAPAACVVFIVVTVAPSLASSSATWKVPMSEHAVETASTAAIGSC